MSLPFSKLIKDISQIDTKLVLENWLWKINFDDNLLLISSIGDIFFNSSDGSIKWLDVGSGEIQVIADDIEDFKGKLKSSDNINFWFLESILEKFHDEGGKLKEDEVLSYKKLPIMGGNYEISNFKPTNLYTHFELFGLLHKQIKDLPNGTHVKIGTKNKPQ